MYDQCEERFIATLKREFRSPVKLNHYDMYRHRFWISSLVFFYESVKIGPKLTICTEPNRKRLFTTKDYEPDQIHSSSAYVQV